MAKVESIYALSYDYSYFVAIKIYKKLKLDQLNLNHLSASKLSSKKTPKYFLVVIAILFYPLVAARTFYFYLKNSNQKFKKSSELQFRARIDDSRNSFIVFGPIDWEYRKQRPQQLSISLAKLGKDIFYINPTIRYHSARDLALKVKLVNGVNVCTFYSSFQRSNFYVGIKPVPKDISIGFARLVEDLIAKHVHFSTIVKIQQPGWWSVVRHLQNNQIIYDCMDLHSGFANIADEVETLEFQTERIANRTIVTSPFLLAEKQKSLGNKVDLVRNGVDLENFRFLEQPIREEQVTVGYFGALAEWFDTEILAFLAQNNPEIRIEIIGLVSDSRVFAELSQVPNITFLGEVPNDELPEMTAKWQAGLIPFKVTPLIQATNPVKMYEYAALGLPILATAIPEVALAGESIAGIYTAVTKEEFQNNFLAAIGLPLSKPWELREWASTQSWDHRISEMLPLLEKTPRVSIVVLMWNQGLLTMNCLKSIYDRSDYRNMEVILVDNGSDLNESFIVTNWIKNENSNRTKYVRNEVNLGFAAGNNVGIKLSTGDFIIVLNNDTEVTPGWIWRSIKHFSVNPNLGLLGPSTNNCGNEARVVLRNQDGNWLHEVIPRFGFRELKPIPAKTIAFFCVVIKRAVIDEVGLISEDYGKGYFEDDDYCRMVETAGYEIAIARDIFVYHQMSASFDLLGDAAKAELFRKNKAVYEAKWGQWIPHTYNFDEDQR